jgi:hypothetical protein
MKSIVIGWNPQAERDIANEANAVSLAFRGLLSAYQEQGVPFSLDVEKALLDVSSEVVLGGSREVSQDKKLELLGINATMLRSQAHALSKACSEFGIQADQLTESGEVPSKILTAKLKAECEILASGEKGIELAETLKDVIDSMEKFYALMVKYGMNRPNQFSVTQATHNMLEADGEGTYRINPNAFALYGRG